MAGAKSRTHDVIVVGGGPAGSTAATFIAMQGHRVLLLERHKLPIYKIGESLLPATVHGICPMLGISEEIKNANFVVKQGGTFLWGQSPDPWTFSFSRSSKVAGPTSTAYQVERMKFDKILLDNARAKGVEVEEKANVESLLFEGSRVAGVNYTDGDGNVVANSARFVIDASGHDSRLARFAGERVYSMFFQNLALFGYYKGGARLPAPNQGNIFTVAFEYGWFWYIPLRPDLTSVGAVVSREFGTKIQGRHEQAMDEFIKACPRIQHMLTNAIRVTDGPYGELRVRVDYSYNSPKFWIPGLALIGDAACFIDPVFSSGVHLATYSALLVARSINTVLKGELDEARCFMEFESRYRREYALFHDFLLAFYDANKSHGTSFWDTRTVTNSPEITNEPFITLVAGLGSSGEPLFGSPTEFFKSRENLSDLIFPEAHFPRYDEVIESRRKDFYKHFLSEVTQLQMQAHLKGGRPFERPLFSDGLIPSRDALHWVDPRATRPH